MLENLAVLITKCWFSTIVDLVFIKIIGFSKIDEAGRSCRAWLLCFLQLEVGLVCKGVLSHDLLLRKPVFKAHSLIEKLLQNLIRFGTPIEVYLPVDYAVKNLTLAYLIPDVPPAADSDTRPSDCLNEV